MVDVLGPTLPVPAGIFRARRAAFPAGFDVALSEARPPTRWSGCVSTRADCSRAEELESSVERLQVSGRRLERKPSLAGGAPSGREACARSRRGHRDTDAEASHDGTVLVVDADGVSRRFVELAFGRARGDAAAADRGNGEGRRRGARSTELDPGGSDPVRNRSAGHERPAFLPAAAAGEPLARDSVRILLGGHAGRDQGGGAARRRGRLPEQALRPGRALREGERNRQPPASPAPGRPRSRVHARRATSRPCRFPTWCRSSSFRGAPACFRSPPRAPWASSASTPGRSCTRCSAT